MSTSALCCTYIEDHFRFDHLGSEFSPEKNQRRFKLIGLGIMLCAQLVLSSMFSYWMMNFSAPLLQLEC